VTEAKRMVVGAVVAAIVIGYGASRQFGDVWGVAVALCAVMLVLGVAALGDQLGRRRAGGH
jgi:hypothetical protein